MHLDAEFWVALGFIIFVIGLGYLGVHTKLNAALDERAKKISAELTEAKRLRDEAEAVLKSFQQKAASAEVEAAAIVTQATREAEQIARDAETRLNEFIARRTQQAETKIRLAETQAASDVRNAAADAAVKIAANLFRRDPDGSGAGHLVDQEIARLTSQFS